MKIMKSQLLLLKHIRTFCRKYSLSQSTSEFKNYNSQTNREWESVIGLEVHAQIASKSKLFSRSSTLFAASPNTQVSYFDASLPGTLPVLNRHCVEAAVLTALALNCTIHKLSLFDRKHYFYADLPTGYQITQQKMPLATNGKLEFVVYNPVVYKIPFISSSSIKQIHLEQDSGRSFHDEEHNKTLVDLNRAGIGLMEIVFEADLHNGEEAAGLIRELLNMMKRLGTCSGQMNEGAIRVDANISVNKPGDSWGTRTELKNINSARYVAKAIDFEIQRQIQILESGGTVRNETRMYDHISKKTIPLRDKETLKDYRYMPEPNLPPLQLCDDNDERKYSPHILNIDNIKQKLPLLPVDDRKRLTEKYSLPLRSSLLLVNEDLHEYFEQIVSESKIDPKYVAQYLLTDFLSQLNKRHLSVQEVPFDIGKFQEFLHLIKTGIITITKAKSVLDLMFEGDSRSSKEIIYANNWMKISDVKELESLCQQVIEKNPKKVKEYQSGKVKTLSFLLTQVDKLSDNRIDKKTVEDILVNKLMNL